jgi:hypothetical protein
MTSHPSWSAKSSALRFHKEAAGFVRDKTFGRSSAMVSPLQSSPIEGTVTDVNEAVAFDPELARKDPYGEGWLVTVQSPNAKTNFRNLLGGALARWWMKNRRSVCRNGFRWLPEHWLRMAAWPSTT